MSPAGKPGLNACTSDAKAPGDIHSHGPNFRFSKRAVQVGTRFWAGALKQHGVDRQ